MGLKPYYLYPISTKSFYKLHGNHQPRMAESDPESVGYLERVETPDLSSIDTDSDAARRFFNSAKNPMLYILYKPKFQSDPACTTGEACEETVVTFIDKNETVTEKSPTYDFGMVTSVMGHENSSISQFLARPLEIETYVWTHGGAIDVSFFPWLDFLTSPTITPKLANYALIRGNLHVRIMINGTPFSAGIIYGGYAPNAVTALTPVRVTQLPHAFNLDPSTNTVHELVLPFLSPLNYLPIPFTGGGLQQMGRVYLKGLGVLKTSNNAAMDANISVWAWMTEVELVVPTLQSAPSEATYIDATTSVVQRAGDDKEKPKDFSVSQLSSAVASALGHLSTVPVIGPFALAGSIAADAVGNIASMFGYSRPSNTFDSDIIKRHVVSPLAYTTGVDDSVKMTFDPHQSTTLDTRSFGLEGYDELSLQTFTRRWSLLDTFNWSTLDTTNTELTSYAVVPGGFRISGSQFEFTGVNFAAIPFEFWGGSMEFKAKVICAQNQSGILRFFYEPTGQAFSSGSTNATYSWLLDLRESTELVMSIGWAQKEAYLKTLATPNVTIEPGFVYDSDRMNGILYCEVVNPLVSPEAVTIYVSMWIRGGKDFELAVPNEGFSQFTTAVQSGFSSVEYIDPYKEISEEVHEAGMDCPEMAKAKPLIFFGEKVVSFRALCKRYERYYRTVIPNTASVSSFTHVVLPQFPQMRAKPTETYAISVNALANDYNYVNTCMLTLLSQCFAGVRGGVRWKVADGGVSSTITATRAPGLTPGLPGITPISTAASISSTALTLMTSSVANAVSYIGMVLAKSNGQPYIEYEVPFYSRYKYHMVLAGTTESPWGDPELMRSRVNLESNNIANDEVFLDIFAAAAEDFNPICYCGPPAMTYVATLLP